ncbi:hypothetical protein ADK76_25600 [Streptomyces griseoflavus]|nr:hypothetical protein ADK76_25600 [Streptomyces griseoflavus]
MAMSWATRCRSEGSTCPSAAATSAHIAMLASRKAPLFSSFFLATSWFCIVWAESLIRSHRAMWISLSFPRGCRAPLVIE